jgi:hypothetical protein
MAKRVACREHEFISAFFLLFFLFSAMPGGGKFALI